MSDIEITMDAGARKRLLTAGKYCDKNILVTAGRPSGGIDIPTPPEDGKTRLYIRIAPSAMEGQPPPRNNPTLYFSQTVSNGVAIDWGDGSAAETVAGTGFVSAAHVYAQAGDYVISMTVAEACELGFGNSDEYLGILGETYGSVLVHAFVGSGVARIGDYAFYVCRSLYSVTIPEGITDIGEYAFCECHLLCSVMIPETITGIGKFAFCDCTSLSSMTIPESVSSIGFGAFYFCPSLLSVTIPESVTSIEAYAFNYCYSLCSVTIPEGVTSVEPYAFSYCFSLSSITIPESVTSIGEEAFSYCYSLSSVTIPENVSSIGEYAFYDCTNIKAFYILQLYPPELADENVFKNTPEDCIFYVPVHSVDAYKMAPNWSSYADQIQALPT